MRQSLLLTSALLLAASSSELASEVDAHLDPESREPESPRPETPNMVITSQWTTAPRQLDPEVLIQCRKCKAPPYADCDRRTLGRHRFHLCRVQDAAALSATGAA